MFNLVPDEIEYITAGTGCIPSSPVRSMFDVENLILRMHEMYSLPIHMTPSLEHERTEAFTAVLQKEVNESKDVIAARDAWHGRVAACKDVVKAFGRNSPEADKAIQDVKDTYLDALVAQADWLTDLIVYCLSEMRKQGLDPRVLLPIVMNSNFTKLGANGEVLKDSDGKVEKGPNFKKPEPTIRAVLALALEKEAQFQGE